MSTIPTETPMTSSSPTTTPPAASTSGRPAAEGARTATGLGAAYREPSQLRVRPYLVTAGRTRSDIELALETTLETTEAGVAELRHLTLERLALVEACREPIPVVELAARIGLPLQVVRVLVGDLVTEGFIVAHAARPSSERPDLALLERVLDGLQNL